MVIPVESRAKVCPERLVARFMGARVDASEYLFTHIDGTVVTAAQVLRLMRLALTFLGLDSQRFGGHSFRIGRCTELVAQGRSTIEVKAIGRWQSHAVDLYHKPEWLVS